MLFHLPLLALSLLGSQDPILKELRRMLPETVSSAPKMFAADLNNDGAPDVLTTNGRLAEVYLNRGSGSLALLAGGGFANSAGRGFSDVLFADLDADGNLDAIAEGMIHFGDGQGFFPDSMPLPDPGGSTGAFGLNTLTLDDFDADGDLDLYVVSQKLFADVCLFRVQNLGGRAFSSSPAQDINIGPSGSTFLPQLIDLNGDAALDFLTINAGRAVPLLQDDQGLFVPDPRPIVGFSATLSNGSFADLDGDGDLDMVLLSSMDGAGIYRNDGTAGFAFVVRLASTPINSIITVVDLEQDGDLDILFTGSPMLGGDPALGNLLLRNDGNFQFDDASSSLPSSRLLLAPRAVADFDQDGFDDLLVHHVSQLTTVAGLLLNDGRGAFSNANTHVPEVDRTSQDSCVGDFNGDGYPDLIAATPTAGEALLWINDGTGAMSDRSDQLPSGLSSLGKLATGDVDGDGDLDVLWPRIGQTQLLINDGTGVFTDETASRLPLDASDTSCVVLADLDGDGDLDALIGNDGERVFGFSAPQEDEIWLNAGQGFFSFAGFLPALGYTHSLGVADIDGDGDLDVLAGNWGLNYLYQNDGFGVLVDVSDQLAGEGTGECTQDLQFGDLNGDGFVDVFFANFRNFSCGPLAYDCVSFFNSVDQVGMNDGRGVFTVTSNPNLSAGIGKRVQLGDLDGDGDLDAVVKELNYSGRFSNGPPTVSILLNDGAGKLTKSSTPLITGSFFGSDLALLDLDEDGDLDLIANLRVFTNRTRSLSWRARPRVGQPLDFEIAGRPGTPYILAGASASTLSDPTRFGNLRLHIPTIGYRFHGRLDEQGEAVHRVVLPDHPALLGKTLYWQAVTGDPQRLTNLEPTTFQ